MNKINVIVIFIVSTVTAAQVKELGNGREVMWDMDRIAALGGGAALKLHHPEQREVSKTYDAPLPFLAKKNRFFSRRRRKATRLLERD